MTDHQPLHWLLTNSKLNGKLARWALLLSEYELDIVHRAGRVHCNADSLSRNPMASDNNDTEARHDVGPAHLAPSACMAYLADSGEQTKYLDATLYDEGGDIWLQQEALSRVQTDPVPDNSAVISNDQPLHLWKDSKL